MREGEGGQSRMLNDIFPFENGFNCHEPSFPGCPRLPKTRHGLPLNPKEHQTQRSTTDSETKKSPIQKSTLHELMVNRFSNQNALPLAFPDLR